MKRERRGKIYRLLVVAAILTSGVVVVLQASPATHAATMGPKAARVETKYAIEPPNLSTLIAKVKPAVVSIAVEKLVTPRSHFGRLPGYGGPDQDWLFRFFGAPNAPAPQPRIAQGQGSGFIVDESGIVVTNYHVIDGAESISVILESGDRLPAEVVGSDEKTDLAVLKVESSDALPFVQFGESDSAAVGDWVVAIGNPFGFGGTATAGIISARGRDLQSGPYVDFIQIDAPINSGNSGGPVFSANGYVIGINTAIYSPNGGNVGLGFAIPSSDAQTIVNELRDRGIVKRGWLGVQIQDVDDALADSLGLESAIGALIAGVVPDSPAANAGADIGDVIVEFNGDPVLDSKALTRLVSRAESGTKAKMIIVRNGKRQALRPRIDVLDDNPTVAAESASGAQLGLQVAPLTSTERDQLGINGSVDGVVVIAVDPNGEGARKGLRRGDVISRVNRDPIHTPNDLRRALTDSRSSDHQQVAVLVHRGSTRYFVTLGLS